MYVMPLDYGGLKKQQENVIVTPIRTQIIVISHYEYTSLETSQYGTNHSELEQVGRTPQNHQKGEIAKLLHTPHSQNENERV